MTLPKRLAMLSRMVFAFVSAAWCHHWNSRVISKIPEIWSSMAGCLDLRKLIRSPFPLSMAALRESFEEIMDWVTSCNIIDHLIPEREELFEQLCVLKRRLQALAKTQEFKHLWKTELDGAGTGTTIMKYLFTDKRLYSDVEDFVWVEHIRELYKGYRFM